MTTRASRGVSSSSTSRAKSCRCTVPSSRSYPMSSASSKSARTGIGQRSIQLELQLHCVAQQSGEERLPVPGWPTSTTRSPRSHAGELGRRGRQGVEALRRDPGLEIGDDGRQVVGDGRGRGKDAELLVGLVRDRIGGERNGSVLGRDVVGEDRPDQVAAVRPELVLEPRVELVDVFRTRPEPGRAEDRGVDRRGVDVPADPQREVDEANGRSRPAAQRRRSASVPTRLRAARFARACAGSAPRRARALAALPLEAAPGELPRLPRSVIAPDRPVRAVRVGCPGELVEVLGVLLLDSPAVGDLGRDGVDVLALRLAGAAPAGSRL